MEKMLKENGIDIHNMSYGEVLQLVDVMNAHYVSSKQCETSMTEQNSKINKIELKLVKIDTKFNVLVGILSAIAVPMIGLCIHLLFKI